MSTPAPIIIPVASGKGGVGKTFVTANLAIALAHRGHKTVAVDLDLGGSNLHSFLGLPNRYAGVGDFLKARSAELTDLIAPTPIENLHFLAGDGRTPFLANIPFAQKIRLISCIRKLPARYVLLDLGAGTTYNTLDFFRLAPHGLLVTTPEYPAVFSLMAFLKHFILRAIQRRFAPRADLREHLNTLFKRPLTEPLLSVADLRREIEAIDNRAGMEIEALCRKFRPRVVFNLGEDLTEFDLTAKIDESLKQVLSLQVDYFGFLFYDASVRKAIRAQKPFLEHHADTLTAACLTRVAERIERFWTTPVLNSARHLRRSTLDLQQKFPR